MPCPLRPCACSVVAASLHAGAVRGGMEDSLPSEGVVLIEASPSQGSLSDEGEGELEDDSAWPAPAEERQQRGRGTPWSGVADGWGGAGLRREHGRESAALREQEELEAELSTVLEEGSSEQMTVGSNVATSILTELVDSAVSRVQEPEPAQEAHHRGDSPNLQDWLADVGAAEYYQSFIQEGFEDLASVLQSRLTEDDLRELGMVAMVSPDLPRTQLSSRWTHSKRTSMSSSQAPRKRVFHALANATLAAAADPAPPHGSELGLTAAVQQLLAALEPAVPAMLAQLQRLDPDGAATAAVSNAVAAAPVRTRGLLPQHVARRPVVADLAAATAAKSSRHNSSARSRPSTAAVHPSTTPAAGQFSIGGADLAIFSRDAPLAAAAVAAAKPRAPSPQAAKPQPPKTVDEPTAGVDAFPKTSGQVVKELSAEEFSERLHAELRANLASAAGEAVRVAASASADAQDAAELADEIRTAVLAWRARTDP
jgi:hypothetical protein